MAGWLIMVVCCGVCAEVRVLGCVFVEVCLLWCVCVLCFCCVCCSVCVVVCVLRCVLWCVCYNVCVEVCVVVCVFSSRKDIKTTKVSTN
jgi:hypothetical protein